MNAEQLMDTCSAKKRPRVLKYRVLEHYELRPGVRRLVLEAPEIAVLSSPGQFVHVLCTDSFQSFDPLLRRPFSINFAEPQEGKVGIMYEIRGRGTALLSTKQRDEVIDLIGPLGRGFWIPEDHAGDFWLVAGGVGVAPLYFLLMVLQARFTKQRIRVILGDRTCDSVLCKGEIAPFCSELLISTDDGSEGHCGLVTELLEQQLEMMSGQSKPLVYACGPMPMLKEIAGISSRWNLNCQVSVETKMACGLGACMGCVIRIRTNSVGESQFMYARACVDGPVFKACDIVWV